MDVRIHYDSGYTPAMAERPRPDYRSRDLAALSRLFTHVAEEECPQIDGWLYQALCRRISQDRELLAISAQAGPGQPPTNMLFAAVHYLLLGGADHPLRDWYPALANGDAQPPDTAFEPFRSFCLEHADAIRPLLESRRVQTNVLQRTSSLLPAFARAFEEGGGAPLAAIEIGCSAGLNLQWDRFQYAYSSGSRWGDPASPVLVECEVRGEVPLPALPAEIPVAWRKGIEIQPIDITDADAVRWLRALVWPDHPGRQERLSAAIEIAREAPPEIREGDASVALPELIAEAPSDATLVVWGTHTLYQFPREALIATFKTMQEASHSRAVRFKTPATG